MWTGLFFLTIARALESSSETTTGLYNLLRARGSLIGIPAKSSLRRSVRSNGFSPRTCWWLKVSLLRGTARMCWSSAAPRCTGRLGAMPISWQRISLFWRSSTSLCSGTFLGRPTDLLIFVPNLVVPMILFGTM
ncbi:hypothetical protein KSP39_PZI017437 [Platanthera zijinensis]|uniref:Secreted protein n=1 Tax=Platanthera zijinensis TaxID=2320716 RepID=A0AAP0B510_9ASPA